MREAHPLERSLDYIERETTDRDGGTKTNPPWGFYVLGAYTVVFLGGMAAVVVAFLTTTDPSLYTSGLTGGFIIFGLSALALLTYPAYRAESARLAELGINQLSFRRYVTIAIGTPLAIGILLEIVGFGMDGDLTVPGFLAGFVAIVLHPVAVFLLTVGFLLRRRYLG